MPNQLYVPFKRTWDVPLRQAAREYILKKYTDTHPDAFRWDITRWETLRKDGAGGIVHIDRVQASLRYHAQLVFILTKLPPDIGLEIPYAPAFNPSALPETLCNLAYERAAVIFNLGALFSQLASAEDRSNPLGLKQAIMYSQNAAGAYNYLVSALPPLKASVAADDIPLEFTSPFSRSMEYLMLAQAQECVWQRAVMDNYKNALIAKLAGKVASLYAASLNQIKDASPTIRHLFPSPWLAHLETKQLHFEAAAQYRKSVDDLEANRYGHELARLTQAQVAAKKGYDIARRGGVAQAVLDDTKSLLDTVQKNFARAERDNDLIYHQDIPSASALPPIQEVSMAQSVIHPGLKDPKTAIGDDAVVFGELLAWGARVAIDIYNDRRQNFIKDEVTERAQHLNDAAHGLLQSLHLPASLEALERPIGLPPSLLRKAEEVRREDGPSRIEISIDNVRKLARSDSELLDKAMDILDQEAEEDETFRVEHSADRTPSQDTNTELIAKAQRYRNILEQASESDDLVRQKWDEWEKNIIELTWDEAQLEASVPSSTISPAQPSSARRVTPTQTHARSLRVLLESLDDVLRSRADLVRRAVRLAESEDIKPRILKAAATIEQWVDVQPSMFEDVLEDELAKYDKFRSDLEGSEQKQSELLNSIKQRNEVFLQSRKEDPSVKEREYALQSLDLAYHKYKEITRNLDEGLKFYNDFAGVLTQFRDSCAEWANVRRQEMHSLIHSLESISLQQTTEPDLPEALSKPATKAELPSPPSKGSRFALDLPPPDSDEWQAMDLPPSRSPRQDPTRRKAKGY
ncbi:hypothetical protein IEO21_01130 [Rhodonia placenta]|uniref:BRO1 domain-containing protein n=1 Tax=Rhodonia placenta TaxID=104341 RepID=A0A8H7PAQ5_9APHY|nr:hypothetical protein IEO21_01130 [Postia placenta]